MMGSKLALLGGDPVRTKLFAAYNPIGVEEKRAVQRVLDSGNLSQFLGANHRDFFGGPNVRAFEDEFAASVDAAFGISVNSNTSGLFAAVGALGVGPGDEVIVSPYSMTASAIAPVIYGAVPIFADIDPKTFCMSPESIRSRITPRTKAILVVHIFGHPADMDAILKIARPLGIRVIEDCAQVPSGKYQGRPLGTLGDIGVFSFNYHKHIHTGEGGMIVTRDRALAIRLQLIRNHGENVAGPMGETDFTNLLGFNYRMPEIEAAIGREQLKKLDRLVDARIETVRKLEKMLAGISGLVMPWVRNGDRHTYYQHAIKWNAAEMGIHRNTFVTAVQAELPSSELRETVPLIGAGYVRPLYLQPIYQQRVGKCAFNCPRYDGQVNYGQGLCPVTERMHFQELFTHEFIRPSMTNQDLDDVVRAFEKVIEGRTQLQDWERTRAAATS